MGNAPTNAPNSDNAQLGPVNSTVKYGKVIQPIHSNLNSPTLDISSLDNYSLAADATPATINPSNDSSPNYNQVATSASQISNIIAENTFTRRYPVNTDALPIPEKQKMPIGVYIIIGFSFIGFIAGFFNTLQSNTIYTIVMTIKLLLSLGLLMRLEIARKLILWVSGVILVVIAISLLLLANVQKHLQQNQTAYESTISKIDHDRLSPNQKQQLLDVDVATASQARKADVAITLTYVRLGITAVECLAVIIYLTRPKITSALHRDRF